MMIPKYVFVACLLLAARAEAADAPAPRLTVQIDPALQQREGVYKATVDALTPAQQATLKSYQGQYLGLVQPEIQLLSIEFEMRFCLSRQGSDVEKDGAQYQSALNDARRVMQDAYNGDWAALRAKQMKETPFIDQKLVDEHTSFMRQLTLGMGRGAMEANYQTGSFAKTDCRATAQTLAKIGSAAHMSVSAPPQPKPDDPVAKVKAAAADGDPEAMLQLATMMLSGTGVPKDVEGGVALMQHAAERGYVRAEYVLGLNFSTDLFGRADKEKARYWLGKAAAQGDQKAAKALASVDTTAPSASIDSLRVRADKGEAGAEYELGGRYSLGLGVDKDPEKALVLLLAAARQGYALAQSDVALLLINANRASEGVEWMTKAANAGVANSEYELAGLYRDGSYVLKDPAKAAYWYRKAAEAGDPRAKKALQEMGAN